MADVRYWLVKAPEGDIADTVCRIFGSCQRQGVEVVEVKPERRGGNWMEAELAKRLTAGLEPGRG